MTKQAIKYILLESLKAAERTLEKDLKKDEQSKKVIHYLLDFFKYVGIDAIEKLTLQGRAYIKGQVQIGIDTFIASLSSAISSLLNLIFGFLIVSIGLFFGAIALSLFLGKLLDSNALGFLVSGILWMIVMLTSLKILFNQTKLEERISRKIKRH
jgi:hypothetical protein